MRDRRRTAGLVLGLLAALAPAPRAHAQPCDADALCPDPVAPCTIGGTTQLPDACILDFGARSIVLTGTLSAAQSGGSFGVTAGALTLLGGTLRATGSGSDPGGTIDVQITGAFRMDPSGPRINVAGANGGGRVFVSAGSIDVSAGSPAITADGTTADAEGGTIVLEAVDGLRIAGTVTANGGSASGGGSVTLHGGSVQLERPLSVNGGGDDGGEVEVVASTGDVIMSATASITSNGGRWDDIGSDGGLVELRADAADVYAGNVVADGATPDGSGGDIGVTARGATRIEARLSAQGPGVDSGGGSIVFDSGGDLLVDATVDAGGGGGDLGGDVTFLVDGDLTVAAGRVVQVNGGAAAGEILSLSSPGALVVAGTLEARGTNGGRGGTIDLGPHCRITLSGVLDARGTFGGSGGDNTITAGSITITATGDMLATPCQGTSCGNRAVLPAGTPTIAPGATIDPALGVQASPGLLPCCGDGVVDAGEACDDGDRLHCDGCGATCAIEPQPTCSAGGLPCVAATCEPERGCVTTPLTGTPCPDDGALCTSDRCVAGACVHSPLGCDDGLACTLDVCDPLAGCRSTPRDSLCDDGSPCTTDRCDPSSGCQHPALADGTPCDDASVCTRDEECVGGACTASDTAVSCDDADPCTTDTCNPMLGCLNTEDPALCPCGGAAGPRPAGTACADGNGCTMGDLCDGAGTCRSGTPRACDDADPCTADLCAGGVCFHADDACPQSCIGRADGTACSDGQACTTGGCQAGACVPAPRLCDDGDPCSGEEFCVNPIGCRESFPPDGTACDDGDPCSEGDVCSDGTCLAGTASPCQACETCDAEAGCHLAPAPSCRPSLPAKSMLLVRDASPDHADLLVWKWLKGDAAVSDFGDPTASDTSTLCVFDGSDSLVLRAEAPAGGLCGGAPCWKALGSDGFRYKDRERTPEGIDKLLLHAGAGRAKIVLKAKGERLGPPPPPFALPIVVQLQNSRSQCFETRHEAADVLRNEPGEFKGRGSGP